MLPKGVIETVTGELGVMRRWHPLYGWALYCPLRGPERPLTPLEASWAKDAFRRRRDAHYERLRDQEANRSDPEFPNYWPARW